MRNTHDLESAKHNSQGVMPFPLRSYPPEAGRRSAPPTSPIRTEYSRGAVRVRAKTHAGALSASQYTEPLVSQSCPRLWTLRTSPPSEVSNASCCPHAKTSPFIASSSLTLLHLYDSSRCQQCNWKKTINIGINLLFLWCVKHLKHEYL